MVRSARTHAKNVARLLLPPILVQVIRRARGHREFSEWEYLASGWPEHDDELRGWDAASVARTQLARWPAYVASLEGTGPLGQSSESEPSEPDYANHNTIMSFAYVLALAARMRDRLSLLDWGSGIGHYYRLSQALMPGIEIDYHCRDLPMIVAGGRNVLQGVTFHDSDESALSRRYDLVLASSSLHYRRDWRSTLAGLAAATDRYLYVTRQPFVRSAQSFVVVQRPYRHGYDTEYPGWFLNRDEFLGAAVGFGLQMVREFLIEERPVVRGAPEQADYRGFLFRVAG